MPVKYPLCLLDPKIRQNDLLTYAQGIHDGIAANPALYPVIDLPIPLATFQTAIDNYQTRLANAVKGSKNETALKDSARQALVYLLRVYKEYIDVAARGGVALPINNYPIIRANILASGFMVTMDPGPAEAIPGLALPIVRKVASKAPGTLYLVVRNYTKSKRGKLMYQLQWRTAAIPAHGTTPAVPAGLWNQVIFTGGNFTVPDLPSVLIDWQIAAIGGRNVRLNQQKIVNFTVIQQVQIT